MFRTWREVHGSDWCQMNFLSFEKRTLFNPVSEESLPVKTHYWQHALWSSNLKVHMGGSMSEQMCLCGRLKGRAAARCQIDKICGVKCVKLVIFHGAFLGLVSEVGFRVKEVHRLKCHLNVCNLSPSQLLLLTGNGRSFSSLSGCLVYHSRLVDTSPSHETRGRVQVMWANCSSI